MIFVFYFIFDIRFRVFLWSQICTNCLIDRSTDLSTEPVTLDHL